MNKIFKTNFTALDREGFASEMKNDYQKSVKMCQSASDRMEAQYYKVRDRQAAANKPIISFKNFSDGYKSWCLRVCF